MWISFDNSDQIKMQVFLFGALKSPCILNAGQGTGGVLNINRSDCILEIRERDTSILLAID